LQAHIIAVGTLASQSWVTGQATYTGLQGQWTADANYKYDCIATNIWIRTPINEARYDSKLNDVHYVIDRETSNSYIYVVYIYPSHQGLFDMINAAYGYEIIKIETR